MSNYIKTNGILVVDIAGQVATKEMIEEGYYKALEPIPHYDLYAEVLHYEKGRFKTVPLVRSPEAISAEAFKFLKDTDWKVFRHLRQVLLGIETSLTQEQYLALELERDQKSTLILK